MGFLPLGRQVSTPARRRRGFVQNDHENSLQWMGFFANAQNDNQKQYATLMLLF